MEAAGAAASSVADDLAPGAGPGARQRTRPTRVATAARMRWTPRSFRAALLLRWLRHGLALRRRWRNGMMLIPVCVIVRLGLAFYSGRERVRWTAWIDASPQHLLDASYPPTNVGHRPTRAGGDDVGGRPLRFDAAGRPAHLRLAFLGDSTCRHLFLSLSYYLLAGRHINSDNATRRLITGNFPTRKDYEQYILDAYNGTLECDCHTPEGPFLPWGRTHKIWQNMYFHGGGDGVGDDDDRDSFEGNFLSHITKPGYFEAHGHWEPAQIYANRTYRHGVRGQHYPVGEFRWAGDWEQTIRSHIARIVPKPDYVVVNAGLWPHDLNETTLGTLRAALDEHGLVGIYKTTNKKLDDATTALRPDDAAGCRALHHCLDLSWTGRVRDAREYMDASHFGPNVNVNLTVQLLRLLKEISTE